MVRFRLIECLVVSLSVVAVAVCWATLEADRLSREAAESIGRALQPIAVSQEEGGDSWAVVMDLRSSK